MNDFSLSALAFVASFAAVGCQNGPIVLAPLATGQLNVTALAGDGTNVYWTTGDGFVRSVSTSGGTVADLAQGLVLPTQIALDDDAVYLPTGSGTINRVPKVGGAMEVLFENEDGVGSLQVDATSLYWLRGVTETSATGQIRKAPKIAGSTVETLLSDSLDPGALALNGSLYFPAIVTATPATPTADTSALYTLPTTGGTPVAAASGSFDSVVTYGANICSAGPDPAALALDPNSTAQAITCTALDGSNPNVVASGLTNVVTTMTLDDTTVYFGTADGTMSAVALDGTSPVFTGTVTSPDDATVVGPTSTGSTGPVTFATGPAGSASLAVDVTQVYWAHENGNAVFAMPKF